jgi:ATP:ADP antiporter, AAA family
MRYKLRTLLNIESGEESMVSMLLMQSVFLGIFIGAFDISAHSLFLSTFDVKMMARGYIISGTVAIILTCLYSLLRPRVHFKNLLVINLITTTILTFLLWGMLTFIRIESVIFLVFIMFGPLNILTLIGLREVAARFYSEENKGKNLRITDIGLFTGILIISFITPIILFFKFQLINLLLVSATSVSLAALIQVVIRNKFSHTYLAETDNREKREIDYSASSVFNEDPYLRAIGLFAVLSLLSTFFIQYLFLAFTKLQFHNAEDMAGFLGLFTGSIMLLIIFFKLIGFKYLLRKCGLRICLIISPLLIVLITTLATVIGVVAGYTPDEFSGFVMFFILLALARLISKSLSESLESPTLKIIYESVERKSTTELHSRSFSLFNGIMVLFSGIVLTGVGLFSFVRLIHFSLLLLVISLVWLYVAFWLLKEYRKNISRTADKAEWLPQKISVLNNPADFKNRFAARLALRNDYFSLISGDYSTLNNKENRSYYETISDYAKTIKDINLVPVLKKISLNTELDNNIRQSANETIRIIQEYYSSLKPGDEKISDAIRTLSGTRTPQTTEILRLFRDSSVESKRLAIYMIGKFGLSDLLSEVCGSLNTPGLAVEAASVLRKSGTTVEDKLIRLYVITSGNARLSKTILQLLSNICTKESAGFFFSRLWSNSRQLKEVAARYLLNCNFRPDEVEKDRLNQLSSDIIGIITWFLSAKISLVRDDDDFLLVEISREVERWTSFLTDILSITYKPASIARMTEKMNIGTLESISYALEMTDIVIDEPIKQKLICLIDLVPDEVKLTNLFQFYPGEIPNRKRLQEDIINRDYNLISLWTKACTLRTVSVIESNDMAESVTALLFSPEELMQEEAANLIARSDKGLYHAASERLPDAVKSRLDNIINGKTNKKELLFDKVQFLARHFAGIGEDDLLSLASELKYKTDFDAGSPGLSEGLILWKLSDDNKTIRVQVLYGGTAIDSEVLNHTGRNFSFYYLPLSAIEQYHFQFPERSSVILKYIDDNE